MEDIVKMNVVFICAFETVYSFEVTDSLQQCLACNPL